MSAIKIALVDDHKIFRDGIKIALKARPNIEVVWEADNGKQVAEMMLQQQPDVILLDLNMPETNGEEVLKNIKTQDANIRIIILSTDEDENTVSKIMEAGANAYLGKTTSPDEIYKAIDTCHNDEYYFNDIVNRAVMNRLLQAKNQPSNTRGAQTVVFSERELVILQLLADDKTTEEISKTVYLSVRSIETIRQNMKTKVEAKTIGGLIMYGVRHKLIS
jgi:DNA-binding NarL/FixJ family response regulator